MAVASNRQRSLVDEIKEREDAHNPPVSAPIDPTPPSVPVEEQEAAERDYGTLRSTPTPPSPPTSLVEELHAAQQEGLVPTPDTAPGIPAIQSGITNAISAAESGGEMMRNLARPTPIQPKTGNLLEDTWNDIGQIALTPKTLPGTSARPRSSLSTTRPFTLSQASNIGMGLIQTIGEVAGALPAPGTGTDIKRGVLDPLTERVSKPEAGRWSRDVQVQELYQLARAKEAGGQRDEALALYKKIDELNALSSREAFDKASIPFFTGLRQALTDPGNLAAELVFPGGIFLDAITAARSARLARQATIAAARDAATLTPDILPHLNEAVRDRAAGRLVRDEIGDWVLQEPSIPAIPGSDNFPQAGARSYPSYKHILDQHSITDDDLDRAVRATSGRAYRYDASLFEEDLINKLGLDPIEAYDIRHIADLRARAWAETNGRDAAEWYDTRLAGVVEGLSKPDESVLRQAGGQPGQPAQPIRPSASPDIPLYSEAEAQINKIISAPDFPRSGALTAERWSRLIARSPITASELSWTGLGDFIGQRQGSDLITAQEMQDFISSNKVRIRQTILQESDPYYNALTQAGRLARVDAYNALVELEDQVTTSLWDEFLANVSRRANVSAETWRLLQDAELSSYHGQAAARTAYPNAMISALRSGDVSIDDIPAAIRPFAQHAVDADRMLTNASDALATYRRANPNAGRAHPLYSQHAYVLPGLSENYREFLFNWDLPPSPAVINAYKAKLRSFDLRDPNVKIYTDPENGFAEIVYRDPNFAPAPGVHLEYYDEDFLRSQGFDDSDDIESRTGWMLWSDDGGELLFDVVKNTPRDDPGSALTYIYHMLNNGTRPMSDLFSGQPDFPFLPFYPDTNSALGALLDLRGRGLNYILTDPDPRNNPDARFFGKTLEEAYAEVDAQLRQSGQAATLYESSHFNPNFSSGATPDMPRNLLFHVRASTRTLPDGKRVLLIDEIQSDWHQTGRNEGYYDPNVQRPRKLRADLEIGTLTQSKYDEWDLADPEVTDVYSDFMKLPAPQVGDRVIRHRETGDLIGGLGFEELPFIFPRHYTDEMIFDAIDSYYEDARANAPGILRDLPYIYESDRTGLASVPYAPLEETYFNTAFRRMVLDAVEQGADYIAWTTGAQQAKRWNQLIAEKLDTLEWEVIQPDPNRVAAGQAGQDRPSYRLFGYKNGTQAVDIVVRDENLNANVGADMAKKIRAADSGVLTGEDLSIGGQGMIQWYDKNLTNYAAKFGKQFNATIQDIALPGGPEPSIFPTARGDGIPIRWAILDEGRLRGDYFSLSDAEKALEELKNKKANVVHSMTITPALRKSATEKGFPLFQHVEDLDAKGAVTFLSDGRAVIHALSSPDVSTALHELYHVFRRDLSGSDLETAARWAANVSGEEYLGPDVWSRSMEEAFARGAERYYAEGIAPTPELKGLFERFRVWLISIYEGIRDSDIDIDVSPEMTAVYDRLLTGTTGTAPSSRLATSTESVFSTYLSQAGTSPRRRSALTLGERVNELLSQPDVQSYLEIQAEIDNYLSSWVNSMAGMQRFYRETYPNGVPLGEGGVVLTQDELYPLLVRALAGKVDAPLPNIPGIERFRKEIEEARLREATALELSSKRRDIASLLSRRTLQDLSLYKEISEGGQGATSQLVNRMDFLMTHYGRSVTEKEARSIPLNAKKPGDPEISYRGIRRPLESKEDLDSTLTEHPGVYYDEPVNTEGEGLYITKSLDEASIYGGTREVVHLRPRNPISADFNYFDAFIDASKEDTERLAEAIFSPESPKDSPWLNMNRRAAARVGTTKEEWLDRGFPPEFGRELTAVLREAGYDAVHVVREKGRTGKILKTPRWTVLIDPELYQGRGRNFDTLFQARPSRVIPWKHTVSELSSLYSAERDPQRQKVLQIYLLARQGRSVGEVSSVTGIPEVTVRRWLRRYEEISAEDLSTLRMDKGPRRVPKWRHSAEELEELASVATGRAKVFYNALLRIRRGETPRVVGEDLGVHIYNWINEYEQLGGMVERRYGGLPTEIKWYHTLEELTDLRDQQTSRGQRMLYEGLLTLRHGGISIPEAAKKVGVSESTLRSWVSLYQEAGNADEILTSSRTGVPLGPVTSRQPNIPVQWRHSPEELEAISSGNLTPALVRMQELYRTQGMGRTPDFQRIFSALKMLQEGVTRIETAKKIGVEQDSITTWVKWYNAGGYEKYISIDDARRLGRGDELSGLSELGDQSDQPTLYQSAPTPGPGSADRFSELVDELASEAGGADADNLGSPALSDFERVARQESPRAIRVFIRRMYSGDVSQVVVKELLQNAVDAVRGLSTKSYLTLEGRQAPPPGQIDLTFDAPGRLIKISDNGSGMSPEVARKELLNLGETLKPEGASGGLGVAKAAIFGNAESIKITTVGYGDGGQYGPDTRRKYMTELLGTGDEWVDNNVGLRVRTTPVDPSTPTGSTFEIQLEKHPDLPYQPDMARSWLQDFVSAQRLSNTNFTIRTNRRFSDPPGDADGMIELSRNEDPKSYNFRPIATEAYPPIQLKGATVDVWVSKEEAESTGIYADILNNGLPQFRKNLWSGTFDPLPLPRTAIFDIHSIVDPEHPDYPFKINREELTGNISDALERYVRDVIGAESLKRESNTLAIAFDSAPPIWAPGRSLHVLDTTGNLPPEFPVKVGKRSWASSLIPVFEDITSALWKEVKSRRPHLPEYTFGGIGLSTPEQGKGYRAVNIEKSGFTGKKEDLNHIYANPFKMLSFVSHLPGVVRLDGTLDRAVVTAHLAAESASALLHELAHQSARNHQEPMTSALTEFSGFTGRILGRAINEIEDRLNSLTDSQWKELLDDHTEYLSFAGGDDLFRKVSGGYGDEVQEGVGLSPQISPRGSEEGRPGLAEALSDRPAGDARRRGGGAPDARGGRPGQADGDVLLQAAQNRPNARRRSGDDLRLSDLTSSVRRLSADIDRLTRLVETAPTEDIPEILRQISQLQAERDAARRGVRGGVSTQPSSSAASPVPDDPLPTGPLTPNEARQALEEGLPARSLLPGNETFVRTELRRRRGFIRSLQESPLYSPLLRRILEDNPDFVEYGPINNPDTLAAAARRVNTDPAAAIARIQANGFFSEEGLDAEADALLLLRRAVETDDVDMIRLLASEIAPASTRIAQQLQLLSRIDDISPEGLILRAYRRINEAVLKKQAPAAAKQLDRLQDEALLRQAREDALRDIAKAEKELADAKKIAAELRRQANELLGIEPGRVTVQRLLSEIYDILFGDETLLQAGILPERLASVPDDIAESYRKRARTIRAMENGPDKDSARSALLAELRDLAREDVAREAERASRDVKRTLTQRARDFEYLINDAVRSLGDRVTPADRQAINRAKAILKRTHVELTPEEAMTFLDDALALNDPPDDAKLEGVRSLVQRITDMEDVQAWLVRQEGIRSTFRRVKQRREEIARMVDREARRHSASTPLERRAASNIAAILRKTDIELDPALAEEIANQVDRLSFYPDDSPEGLSLLRSIIDNFKSIDPIARELSRQQAIAAARARSKAASIKAANDLQHFINASSRKVGRDTTEEQKAISAALTILKKYNVEFPEDLAIDWLARAKSLEWLNPEDARSVRKLLLDEIRNFDPVKQARDADRDAVRQAAALRQRAKDIETLAGRNLATSQTRSKEITLETIRKSKVILRANPEAPRPSDELIRDWMERAWALRSMPTNTPTEKLAQFRASQSLIQEVADIVPPKFADSLLDAWGLSRMLKATWDMSYTFRQGILRGVAHPVEWGKAVNAQFWAFFSEEVADAVDADFLYGDYANIFAETGLSWVDRYAVSSRREELLTSRFVSKYAPLVGRSERSYITAGNKQRMEAMRTIINSWLPKSERGRSFKNLAELAEVSGHSVEDFYRAANWINVATGRGSTSLASFLRNNGTWLNATFFSPRFAMSRVQVPYYAAKDLATSPAMRRIILRDLGSYISANYAILWIADQHPDIEVEWDPRSSDFGKIRYGNIRIDFWGGMQPVVRYLAQTLPTPQRWEDWRDLSKYDQYRKTETGKIVEVEGGVIGSIANFLRTKLQPTAATALDLGLGSTITGERLDAPVPVKDPLEADLRQRVGLDPSQISVFERQLREIASDFIPFLPIETQSGYREEGPLGASIGAVASTLGVGFGAYSSLNDAQDSVTKELYDNPNYNNGKGYSSYLALPPRYRYVVDKDPRVADKMEESDRNVRISRTERVKVSMDNYDKAIKVLEFGEIDAIGRKKSGLKDLLDAGATGKVLGDRIREAKDTLFKYSRFTFNPELREALAHGIDEARTPLLKAFRDEYLSTQPAEVITRGPGGQLIIELDYKTRDAERAAILRRAVEAGIPEEDVLDKKSPWTDPKVREAVEKYENDMEKLRPYYELPSALRANNPKFDEVMRRYDSTPADSPLRERIRQEPEYRLYNEILRTRRERLRRDLRTGIEKAGRSWLGWVPLEGLPRTLP